MKLATLVFEDGTVIEGQAFGAETDAVFELVFNTSMTGYQEILTDPSYRGQILVCTYPLVGNYGVPPPRPRGSIDPPFESARIQVQGLVVQHYVDEHRHYAAQRSLGEWLRAERIPAVTGIDTRSLTRKLRERGTMRAWLLPHDADEASAERAQ